jgi:hypothetical protein
MNLTTHPVAPEELMAWLDGELSGIEARNVAAHVDDCVECANLAAQFRSTTESLAGWSVPAIPSTVEDAIINQPAKATTSHNTHKPITYTPVSLWNWKLWAIGSGGAVAALLACVAIFVSTIYHEDHPLTRSSVVSMHEQKIQSGSASSFSVDGQSITDQESKVAKGKSRPLEGESRRLESLVTSTAPGVTADSNGLFHGLGDHARNSFTIGGQAPAAPGPMIARTVSLTITVKDFAAARASLDSILARHHGYSAQLTVSTPENSSRSFQASLRIPAPELAATLAELRVLGRVQNESQSGEEVTQQHTDLLARLKNSRETEARLQAILQQRTGKVEEVLQVEEEIERVRGEIESMEADQKTLEHRVDFASVDLQLNEEFKAQFNSPDTSASTRIHNAFVAGLDNAAATLLGFVLFFEEYGPVLLIWLVILGLPSFFVWRRYRKVRGQF